MKKWYFILSILQCVILVVLSILAAWSFYSAQQELRMSLASQIETTRTELISYTKIVSRNGVDERVVKYVPACSTENRRTFERLLSTLDTASISEIEELQTLYPSCGRFFALQKQALVQRLQDKVDGLIRLLHATSQYNESAVPEISAWQNYVSAEQERADAFSTVVAIQGQLIDNQIPDNEVSESDLSLLERAQAVQSRQDSAGTQARAYLDEIKAYAISP